LMKRPIDNIQTVKRCYDRNDFASIYWKVFSSAADGIEIINASMTSVKPDFTSQLEDDVAQRSGESRFPIDPVSGFGSFSDCPKTSGNKISVAGEAFETTEGCPESGKEAQAVQEKQISISFGFSTAGGKRIDVSSKALDLAKKLFEAEDLEGGHGEAQQTTASSSRTEPGRKNGPLMMERLKKIKDSRISDQSKPTETNIKPGQNEGPELVDGSSKVEPASRAFRAQCYKTFSVRNLRIFVIS